MSCMAAARDRCFRLVTFAGRLMYVHELRSPLQQRALT